MLATFCHESFNALLFTRNVRSLKLLMIELLDDQLHWPDCIEQTSVLDSAISSGNRRALCEDEPTAFKLLHILAHGVAAHTDCIADGGIACVALIRLAVFYVEQITVDDDCSRRQPKLVDTIRQRKIIFRRFAM